MKRKSLVLALMILASMGVLAASAQALEPAQAEGGSGGFLAVEYLDMIFADMGVDYFIYGTPSVTTAGEGDIKDVIPDADQNYRFTLGWRFPESGLDVTARYMEVNAQGKDTSRDPNNLGSSPLTTPQYGFVIGNRNIREGQATIDLDYDEFVVEIGSKVRLSPSLISRFFVGVQWIDIERDVKAEYSNAANTTTVLLSTEIKGAGIRAGADNVFELMPGVGVYGNFAGGVLDGTLKYKQKQEVNTSETINVRKSAHQVIPMLEAEGGLSFAIPMGDALTWTNQVGYQYMSYFNLLDKRAIDDVQDNLFTNERFDVTMYGLVVRTRLDF